MSLTSQPSYGMEPVVKMMVNGVTGTFSTSGGLPLQVQVPIGMSGIPDVVPRFANTFEEARILTATVNLRPLAFVEGVTAFWFSETPSTPDYDKAIQRSMKTVSNATTATGKVSLKWKASSLQDLEFRPITTAVVQTYFNAYTDNLNFGAPLTNILWHYQIVYQLQFKGLTSA